jgi:hypothetical protein
MYEVLVESGSIAAGTYAQSFKIRLRSNAAFDGDFPGDFAFSGVVDFDGVLKANSTIKHHYHAATGEYAYQLRTESNVAVADFFGMDCEVHQMTSRTAGSLRGLSMTGRLTAAKTLSGNSYFLPGYFNLDIDGIVNGAGVMLAAGYFVMSDGGTFTELSHMASAWLDNQQAGTVNGSHEFLYMTNNGASVMDQAMFIWAGNKITNLFRIETASGMVSAATTSAYTYTKWRRIKVVVGGSNGVGEETGYLIVDIV